MSILLITHPPTYIPERQYIYKVIFKEFLGINFETKLSETKYTEIKLLDSYDDKKLIVLDQLFSLNESQYLRPCSMPKLPLDNFIIPDFIKATTLPKEIPVIFGNKLTSNHNTINGIDIFGNSFFNLTRYEEIVINKRDEFDRFSATEALAYKAGFLERPIVNEYVELLWCLLKHLWPNIKRRKREFKIILSHDVDYPLSSINDTKTVFRQAVGDIIKRKAPSLAVKRLLSKITNDYSIDPYNTFSFIMDLSEKHNLKSCFYFMAGQTNPNFDSKFYLEHPWIRKLLKEIFSRGHEIGIHFSFDTYLDINNIQREFNTFKRVLEQEKITQDKFGSRQHYLRFRVPFTWGYLAEVGLNYDTSLTFADHIGFRCGTCYQYPVFDIINRKEIKLYERPLIVMDGTLFNYMKLKPEEVLNKIELIKFQCYKYKGDFTLLWHNSQIDTLKIYKEIINLISFH